MLRYWHAIKDDFQNPNLDCDGRRVIGVYFMLNGMTRIIFHPIVALDFMPDVVYGFTALIVGDLLLATSLNHYRSLFGRIVALAGAALCIAWAVDLGFRANAFWGLIIFGFILFREAVRA